MAQDLQDNLLVVPEQVVSNYVSLTADTVTGLRKGADETVYITPAGTIAALTFVFPEDINSRIGQTLCLVSTQIVTTLTVSSSGLTLKGTAVTALAVNTAIIYRKVAALTWLRLQ